jgi:hypothetical protein
MNAQASERMSAAKTGWVIVLLMAAWAAFLILPFGREEKGELSKVAVLQPGEAELAAVGLRYNVDWIGLPQYFAVWADRIVWTGDRTEFAYWDPSSRSYAYQFEAIRAGKGYRFRLLSVEPAALLSSESVPESDTHPFVFTSVESKPDPELKMRQPPMPPYESRDLDSIQVDLKPARLEPPQPLKPGEEFHGEKH